MTCIHSQSNPTGSYILPKDSNLRLAHVIMECHHALRDRLLVDFIVTYDNDLDEDSWRGIAEMLSTESTLLNEKVDFLKALFPCLETKFDGKQQIMEKFVEELVEITQDVTPASGAARKDIGRKGEIKEHAKSSSSLSSEASAKEDTTNQKQVTYAEFFKIFERYGIRDSEIDEETVEYLVDILGSEEDQADRSDQLELLQMYLPTDVHNQMELLDDMITLSKQIMKKREQAAAAEVSTSPSSPTMMDMRKEKGCDSTEQAWMASEENKEYKKSILQMYNKEFVTGPGDIVEKNVGVNSSSSRSKKYDANALLNPTIGDHTNKIRYRDGEIVARKGEKFITIDNPNDEYDGGSRGKVKLKGKRGVGWVNG